MSGRATVLALAFGLPAAIVSVDPLWRPYHQPPDVLKVVETGWLPLALVMLGCAGILISRSHGALVVLLGIVVGVLSDRARLQPEIVWFGAVSFGLALRIRWLPVAAVGAVLAQAGVWALVSLGTGTRLDRWELEPGRPVEVDPSILGGAAVLALLLGSITVVNNRPRWSACGVVLALVVLAGAAAFVRPSWAVWAAASAVVAWDQRVEWMPRKALAAGFVTIAASWGGWAMGFLDAGTTMQLYSTVAARAEVCDEFGACESFGRSIAHETDAYLPAQRAVFVSFFAEGCARGEWLVVTEPLTIRGRQLSAYGCR